MSHSHNHGSDGKLSIAVFINILLTLAQIIGGIISGSLSLIADALHNLSDAGAIVVAIIARKIGNKGSNKTMTYGYKRAEIIGVLINSTSLIAVGIYLIIESVGKYFNPTPIDGWIVFWIAGIALVIDLATAFLTYSAGAKNNMNIRAAFIHNISDALASVVVIIAGLLIIYFQLYIFDVIATIGISLYVIYHGCILLKKCIMIIMQAAPDHISIEEIENRLASINGIKSANHIHVWQLDDEKLFLEAHIILDRMDNEECEKVKNEAKLIIKNDFGISHSTVETRLS
ncbi:cation diffusion facilitator family transporter [Shewanella waksmanii]|uniref:cation diffusion facilitator family transporter n=1 Tax=Shewanella waksmanii TaxID=213783 RepID=UPI003735F6FC